MLTAGQPQLDEGNYQCAIVSLARENQPIKLHRFELRLVLAPRLAPFEFPPEAQVGMKVMLTCSALEGQQPISFVWLKDNKIISADPLSGRATGEGVAKGPTSSIVSTGNVLSLNQLHQQQLSEKLALGAGGSLALNLPVERQEYVMLSNGANTNSMTTGPNPMEDLESETSGSLQPTATTITTTVLSDSSIRVRQSDDYSILSIERLELKHAGRYTCSAQNEAARTSHSSQLAINGEYMECQ